MKDIDTEASSKLIKEVIVSRKCVQVVFHGVDVFVLVVMACSTHRGKDDMVAVCIVMKYNDPIVGWILSITHRIMLLGPKIDAYYTKRSGL